MIATMLPLLTASVAESSPAWIDLVSNWLANLPIVLFIAGLVLLILPGYKAPWVIETGMWLIAVGVIILSLGLVAVIALRSPVVSLLVALPLAAYFAYLLPASHRGLAVDTEATIAAPRERVFACASDPAMQPRLMPVITESYVKGGGPLGPGAVIVGKGRVHGMRLQGEDMLLEFDPPRRYTERTLGVPLNQVTVTFETTGDGTHVLCQYRGLMSYPNAVVAGWLMRSRSEDRLRRHRQAWLEAIRREVTQPVQPSA
jgi:uncharacterized protein YndB with AHSA1/START domain